MRTEDAGYQPGQAGWLLLPPESVPDEWQDRTVDLKLVPLLDDEADALLAGRTVEQTLEPADLRLLRLAARGLTTDEIARDTHLDRRTVQRRLGRLRRRLGVSSKSEMAAYLARRGF